jgi:PTH1 family peptidyl-tRNA hydrolase
VQLKFDGSGAGHNGVGSIIEHLGTKFWRLRFGVGHPRANERAGSRREVIDHVLKRASGDDETAIVKSLQEAAAILPVLIEQGAERAKNRLHIRKPAGDAPNESKETK